MSLWAQSDNGKSVATPNLIHFERIGELDPSNSFAYLLTKVPLDSLVLRTRVHFLLVDCFDHLAKHYEEEHPEMAENLQDLREGADFLSFQVESLLATLTSSIDDSPLHRFDSALEKRLSKIANFTAFLNKTPTLEEFLSKVTLSDHVIEALNNISDADNLMSALDKLESAPASSLSTTTTPSSTTASTSTTAKTSTPSADADNTTESDGQQGKLEN